MRMLSLVFVPVVSAFGLSMATPASAGSPKHEPPYSELNGAFPTPPEGLESEKVSFFKRHRKQKEAHNAAASEAQKPAAEQAPPPAPPPETIGASGARESKILRKTECGLDVVAVSPHAVGDPCMTTDKFMVELGMTERARQRVLGVAH